MTTTKPTYRKRRLFPRTLDEVVKVTTKPMLDAQGNFTIKLMRDWGEIVGHDAAKSMQPKKVIFPKADATGGVLHLSVAPELAPEITYRANAIIEQIARYTGFKAIDRIIIHAEDMTSDKSHKPL
ncbi:MAG: DUF721 domain-containing protein [Alphaproteobacteria bacterium]|nr:DUF721 domain-containing protein [Alphaproteobacteria bacterium]